MAVKDGETQNGAPKMPNNVTSETQRKWWWNDDFGDFFLLLLLWILATFPPASAEAFAAAAGPQMGNTMAVKDGEAPKMAPRKCLT